MYIFLIGKCQSWNNWDVKIACNFGQPFWDVCRHRIYSRELRFNSTTPFLSHWSYLSVAVYSKKVIKYKSIDTRCEVSKLPCIADAQIQIRNLCIDLCHRLRWLHPPCLMNRLWSATLHLGIIRLEGVVVVLFFFVLDSHFPPTHPHLNSPDGLNYLNAFDKLKYLRLCDRK